ncbi:MAG: DNA/RNA non-specific endonuclease, partial [Sulfurovaceae bacterium]|nr:DNA/RNA non-specific endonuclease [Sulfurovaceae bacterium]
MSKYEVVRINSNTEGFTNNIINSLLRDKYDKSYCDQIIENDGFTIAYSYKYKAPIFAETILEWNDFTKKMKRKAGFVKDSRIPKKFSQATKDYSKSGYEKGHMIPAIMTRRSELAQNQSFFYTNIVPQLRKVNNPVIREIERYAKNLAYEHGSIHYLVGCTFGKYCIH